MSAITRFTWDGKFETYRAMLPIVNYSHIYMNGALSLRMITSHGIDTKSIVLKLGQQILRTSGGWIVLLSPQEKE